MNAWINGRKCTKIDYRDRGLQYGDGVFETMRIRHAAVRLLEYHLERLDTGCQRLKIASPPTNILRGELRKIAARCDEGILKLIVTRGRGQRGYRPTGRERHTRVLTLHALPKLALTAAGLPVSIRLCTTQLGLNPQLAGIKTLNRLESVIARMEWSDTRIWEGLLKDADENIVCGTMSNLFVRRGAALMTPPIDRCGVLGVMRRWVLATAREVRLKPLERRVRWQDLSKADEVFMCNAVVGLRSVGVIVNGGRKLRYSTLDAANRLRERLDLL